MSCGSPSKKPSKATLKRTSKIPHHSHLQRLQTLLGRQGVWLLKDPKVTIARSLWNTLQEEDTQHFGQRKRCADAKTRRFFDSRVITHLIETDFGRRPNIREPPPPPETQLLPPPAGQPPTLHPRTQSPRSGEQPARTRVYRANLGCNILSLRSHQSPRQSYGVSLVVLAIKQLASTAKKDKKPELSHGRSRAGFEKPFSPPYPNKFFLLVTNPPHQQTSTAAALLAAAPSPIFVPRHFTPRQQKSLATTLLSSHKQHNHTPYTTGVRS